MKRALLFVKDSDKAKETARYISDLLQKKGVMVSLALNRGKGTLPLRDKDLMVVIGGDGTFLAGARIASRFGVPVVGVNEGRFGFLTEIEKEEAEEAFEAILSGRAKPQRRMMISSYLIRNGKRKRLGTFLNDVVVSKSAISRIMEVEVFADGKFMVHVHGDGVIVSTPTGSTAYSLSAGGPILMPESRTLLVVPVCSHTLSNRPVVLPAHNTVVLRHLSGTGSCFLTMDGQVGMDLKRGDLIEVRASKRVCKIFTHPYKDFFEILRTKLGWG